MQTQTEVLTVSPIQNLAATHHSLKALDAQIAEAEETFGLKAMREKRNELAHEFETELSRIAPTLEYGEDAFLKALKKKGESYREGSAKIMRTSTTRRTVLIEKFVATFPDLVKSVCKIELSKADALVGKTTMDAFVEKETTYRYEYVDMEA